MLRADGTRECVLDIPKWNFDWQLSYALHDPVVVNPGDQLRIECHWDNSAENQPIINGQKVEPTNISPGESGGGTNGEMCPL